MQKLSKMPTGPFLTSFTSSLRNESERVRQFQYMKFSTCKLTLHVHVHEWPECAYFSKIMMI